MFEQLRQHFAGVITRAAAFGVEFLPKLGIAAIIMVLGWITAGVARRLTYFGLRALGADVFFERLGGDRLVDQRLVQRRPSQLGGVLVYGLVWLVTVLGALDVLGMGAASEMLSDLLNYMPRLLVAAVMLGLGLQVTEFAAGLIRGLVLSRRTALGAVLVWMTRTGMMTLVLLAVAEQLGISSSIITAAFFVIGGGAALTLVLSVGLGGREFAQDVLAGYALRWHVRKGMHVVWHERDMTVVRMGLVSVELRCGEKILVVRNAEVLGDRLVVRET